MRNHKVLWDVFPPSRPRRTKLDILAERVDFLREQLARTESDLESLYLTKCGLKCSGCGATLDTEADFAGHFTIPDERYLNLGGCPEKDKR